jgi:hypothetical protein
VSSSTSGFADFGVFFDFPFSLSLSVNKSSESSTAASTYFFRLTARPERRF